jgi:hypothetical protein
MYLFHLLFSSPSDAAHIWTCKFCALVWAVTWAAGAAAALSEALLCQAVSSIRAHKLHEAAYPQVQTTKDTREGGVEDWAPLVRVLAQRYSELKPRAL